MRRLIFLFTVSTLVIACGPKPTDSLSPSDTACLDKGIRPPGGNPTSGETTLYSDAGPIDVPIECVPTWEKVGPYHSGS